MTDMPGPSCERNERSVRFYPSGMEIARLAVNWAPSLRTGTKGEEGMEWYDPVFKILIVVIIARGIGGLIYHPKHWCLFRRIMKKYTEGLPPKPGDEMGSP